MNLKSFYKTCCLLLISLCYMQAAAQSFKDNFFHSYGFNFEFIATKGFTHGSNNKAGQFLSLAAGGQYEARYNLHNINDNVAISVSLIPGIGFSYAELIPVDQFGLGNINIPAFANFEFGAGSTYDTSADWGGVIGIGYGLSIMPLFGGDLPEDIKKTFGSPLLRFSIRKIHANELNLRAFFIHFWPGNINNPIDFGNDINSVDEYRNIILRVGVGQVLNY